MNVALMLMSMAFGGLRIYTGLTDDKEDITVFQIALASMAIIIGAIAVTKKKVDPMAPVLVALSLTAHT